MVNPGRVAAQPDIAGNLVTTHYYSNVARNSLSSLHGLVPCGIVGGTTSKISSLCCENYSKPRLAAHHVFVGLGCTLQREDFRHGPYAGEHAEGERIL